jgi:hypothetical protein
MGEELEQERDKLAAALDRLAGVPVQALLVLLCTFTDTALPLFAVIATTVRMCCIIVHACKLLCSSPASSTLLPLCCTTAAGVQRELAETQRNLMTGQRQLAEQQAHLVDVVTQHGALTRGGGSGGGGSSTAAGLGLRD